MTSGPSGPEVHLVTGERGAGKTTFCRVLVEAARSARPRLVAAGILSLKVLVDGAEVAIDAVDVASGQRRRLAFRRAGTDAAAGPSTIRWQFDAGALAWGDALLRSATPCDLLVIDELGPLEFDRGEGWVGGLAAVDGAAYLAAFVAVRPELLGRARRRWPQALPIRIESADQAAAAARRSALELRRRPGCRG
ncbi:MAG: nucleoside-triphosphatase [Actinomycetota bacterium]